MMTGNRYILQVIFLAALTGGLLLCLPEARAADIYEDSFGASRTIRLSSVSGYHQARMGWSVAAPDQSPNILSELNYDGMKIYSTGLDVRAVVNQIVSKASIRFGRIAAGIGTDSDYREDNRGDMYSQSQSSLSDQTRDFSIGLGYQMDFLQKKLLVAPLAGLSYRSQEIRQTNGTQTVSAAADKPASGAPISGLDSTYEAGWRTIFVGVDLDLNFFEKVHLVSSLEYHTASYEASADWNLRQDFAHPVSFVHEATGQGRVVRVAVNRPFAEKWLIGVAYSRQSWKTQPGTDTLYWAGGGATQSRLNGVTWESQSIHAIIGYTF